MDILEEYDPKKHKQPCWLISRTSLTLLVASSDLEARWAGLEPSAMPLLGPPDPHVVGWIDLMKDREIGR